MNLDQMLADYTNQYADFHQQSIKKFENWNRVTREHILLWILATLEMSIHRVNDLRDHWRDNDRGTIMVRRLLSRDLYELISRAMTTYSKSNENDQLLNNHPDKAYKVCYICVTSIFFC